MNRLTRLPLGSFKDGEKMLSERTRPTLIEIAETAIPGFITDQTSRAYT